MRYPKIEEKKFRLKVQGKKQRNLLRKIKEFNLQGDS